MDRTILHCDLNGFYASVELLDYPELRDKPMAVSGDPKNRHGIILAKNEIAKGFGIKTGETIWQAKKKCPNLVLAPPHHDKYARYSKQVNKIYEGFTDMVEPFGIDESWLDITGSLKFFKCNGEELANLIRKRVREETGLTISVGVSFNKVFAKLGSDYKKPDATTVITRDNYKDIVFPLPVTDLLFVGKVSCEMLRKIGIKTIGQLAEFDREGIKRILGKMGETIHDYANGIDDSPVRSVCEEHDVKSVGNGMTFKRDLIGIDDICAGVVALSDTVGMRLRKYGFKCSTIQVAIKDPNFKIIQRQKKLEKPTFVSREIADIAIEIIKSSWNLAKPIRSITLTGANLVHEDRAGQISMFGEEVDNAHEKLEKIERTIDNIREKYGKNSISFGSNKKKGLGIDHYGEDEK